MKITYHVYSSSAFETDGVLVNMAVYLPPKETDADWLGVLSYGERVEYLEPPFHEHLKQKLTHKLSGLSSKHKSKRANVLKAKRVMASLRRLEQRPPPSYIRLPAVAFNPPINRLRFPSAAPEHIPLLPEDAEALRAVVGSLALAAVKEEMEPVTIIDGGGGSLLLETHRRQLSVAWNGSSAPDELRPLLVVLSGIWRTYGGQATFERAALARQSQ